MFRARRLSPMVGLFAIAFLFAVILTMTMVSNTYACGPAGVCYSYHEECPIGCDGGPCTIKYESGGPGPCCGAVLDIICWVGP